MAAPEISFTIENYKALKKAIATGVYSVTYGDKTLTYRSMKDMERLLEMMEKELFPERFGRRRRLASVDRGYFTNVNTDF
jgi:hypothetical protein